MVRYYLYRLAGLLAPHIPRSLGYAVMGLAAAIAYRASASNRAMISANVRHVLGQQASRREIDQTVRRIFRNLFKNFFDLFWLPGQTPQHAKQFVEMRGYENFERAYAAKKGFILVTMHLGNLELMTHVAIFTDIPITLVVERLKPERLFTYIMSLRQKAPLRLIAQDGALRELFRALRRGEGIALALDRDVTESGRVTPFFGAPAKLPDGYAQLALKFGAAILPAFVARTAGDHYVVSICEAMSFSGRADDDADVRRVMAAVGAVAEHHVRQLIDQWVYFHYLWEDDKERIRRGQPGPA